MIPQGHAPAAPVPPPHDESESADLFDYTFLRHCAGFTLRAVWRHKFIAFLCFSFVVALAVGFLAVFPKTYRVQTIILALRNPVMSTLSNPNLFRPYESDTPTRAARETVLRRDNLVALINQTNLLDKERMTRAPAYRFRDRMFRLVAGRERTHDEQVDELADTLEKKLTVDVAEGTVTIAIEWSDADTAKELVEAAMQNFLETRHTTEISIVSDAIAILESYANNLQTQINANMEEVNAREHATRKVRHVVSVVRPRTAGVAPTRPAAAASSDPEVAHLQANLTAKKRAIADLDDFRQHRLAELQAQLLQYQATYAEGHPAVQSTRQAIEALTVPSPQIEQLKSEAADLERQIVRKTPANPDTATIAATVALPRDETVVQVPAAADAEFDDPKLVQDKSQLRMLLNNYSNVLERISAARLELDASQAAFKYRYSVVSPPQKPNNPIRPKRSMVLAASLVGGILLALLAAALIDVRSGRVIERWQVERHFGIPVLAELHKR